MTDYLPSRAVLPMEGGTANGQPVHQPPGGEMHDQRFFAAYTKERVSASRRTLRPLAVVALRVVPERSDPDHHYALGADPVVNLLVATIRDSDTSAHADDGTLLVLLEDTDENGALAMLSRVRDQYLMELPDHLMWAGLSVYPINSFNGDELIDLARDALANALVWPHGRIEASAAQSDR